jgi:hypothetical protein
MLDGDHPPTVERYKAFRMAGKTIYEHRLTSSTVNQELACLKHMFHVARKGLSELKRGVPP